MLENCTDLLTCETRLSEAVKHVRLLGEIPLSIQDIELLAELVRDTITPNISRGTRYLKTRTPACLACFLVGVGRFYDKETGYWPVIETKIGAIDNNWKVKWGKIFNKYLELNGLPQFNEEEGLVYVTPILSHTCIPDCCLDEYFDRVLVPLINRDLLNPLDQYEIIHDLNVRRKINERRLELEQKNKEHNEWLKTLQQENRNLQNQLEKYEKVESLLAEEDEIKRRKTALHGLENAELTRSIIVNRINEINESIQRLESEAKTLWGEITFLEHRYQPVLEVKPQIDIVIFDFMRLNELSEAFENEKRLFVVVITEWSKLSSESWNDSFGVELVQLPLEQLLGQIEQYQQLQEKQKIIQERIGNLEASQKEAKILPTLVSSLMLYFRAIWIWIGRKNPVSQTSELQELHMTYHEAEVQLQLQQGMIKRLFARLPIEERLLDYPTPELHKELCSLKLIYTRFEDTREKRIKLEEEEGQLTGQVRDLASSLDIAVDGNLNALVNRLCEVLKVAEQNQAAALEVKRILEKEIHPVLEAAQLEYQSMHADLDKLNQQLTELGGGSTQQGLSLVQEFHQSQAAVTLNRQNLSSRYSDLMVIESELHIQGWDTIRRGLEAAVSQIENRIQSARSELKQIERRFDSHPAQYFSVDEPIRRFLLYGGITAENYLTDCVLLFARAKSGERFEDISDLHLPNRIIQHFQQWWKYYRTMLGLKAAIDEETNPATGEIFRMPQISFDTATGEVIAKLPSQRFLRPDHGTTVRLDVFSADHSTLIYAASLTLYNRMRGLVDTRSSDNFVLTTPSEKYIFRLNSKDDLIHEWEIPGPGVGAPFLAFSSISHRLIKGENLPRSPLIIVVYGKFRIHPPECVFTEGGFLFGGWKEYAWYEVDLSTIEEFCLSSHDGQSLTIPLTPEFGSGTALIGGNQLAGILSDGRPVFALPPEFIHIQINDRDDLHLFRFSIFWEDGNQTQKSKHYQVDELVNLLNKYDDGWIDIPLNVEQLLGTNPIGCFILRVYKPPYLDWQLSFCIVSQLNASFDKEVYLPYRGKIPDIIATLTFPEMGTFKPDSPAKLISEDGTSWRVQTPASENEITGMLLCSTVNGESINIPITFSIPKLRWRLQGLDDPQYNQWFDEVQKELWIGDWIKAQELFLVVETPWFYVGKVSLVLPGNLISIELGNVHDQKVRVDLKALEDALRAGPSLEIVNILLNDARTKNLDIPLFTVRTRWLAEKIQYAPSPEDDSRLLFVSWDEKGRTEQVIVRLWRLLDNKLFFVKDMTVHQGKHEVAFRLLNVEFPSGKYLIHLEPHDPWSTRSAPPQVNAPNSQLMEINWEIPKGIITLQSVCVEAHINDQRIYPLPRNTYNIQIVGKVKNWRLPEDINVENIDHILVTSYNEDWFVGNLEVNGVPEVIAHLNDTNPVKFEYDTQKHIVTSIEDRHGDGATYCWDCKMLFWYQETVDNEKKRHGNHNYIPIEFRVTRKSE